MSLVIESPEIRDVESNSSVKYTDFKDLDTVGPSGLNEILASFAAAHSDESLNADLLTADGPTPLLATVTISPVSSMNVNGATL